MSETNNIQKLPSIYDKSRELTHKVKYSPLLFRFIASAEDTSRNAYQKDNYL